MIAHDVKRVSQTPRTFANWGTVLLDMAKEKAGRGPDTLTFVTRNGQRISCPNQPGARVPIYEIFAEDCYDLGWFLGPLSGRPIRVLDIGAHVGAFACDLARLHPEATIECFEPSRRTAAFLRRNIEQNGFTERVSVSEDAIADQVGSAHLLDNGGGSALNGLQQPGAGLNGGGTIEVTTTTFDIVAAARPAAVDVVKLDCEGGEYAAVLSSSLDSWSSVQRVVLEYHPSTAHSWPELRTWFADRGLAVLREESAGPQQGTAWLARNGDPR